MQRLARFVSIALVFLLVACGGDSTPTPGVSGSSSPAATASANASAAPPTASSTPDRRTPTPTPTPPPDLTSKDVCDLVPPSIVAQAIGLETVEQEPVDASTPQCSYRFASGDSTNNVVLAVMRDSDVGGRTGPDAFEYAVSVNRALGGDSAKETEVPNLGDQAVFMSGSAVNLLIVQAGLRIVTLAGSELTLEQAAAIAAEAVAP